MKAQPIMDEIDSINGSSPEEIQALKDKETTVEELFGVSEKTDRNDHVNAEVIQQEEPKQTVNEPQKVQL